MTREELMALADELESMDAREGCRTCPADGTKDCRGDLSCEEAVARAASRRIREIAEHDACEESVTTVSAYDILPDEDRKAIAWVREHGGLDMAASRFESGEIAADMLWGKGHGRFWTTDEFEEEISKRLMPEGMEWPTVDSKPVVIGERMRSCGIDDCKVVGIDPANSRLILASDNIEEGKATYFTDLAEYCHRPMPKVHDADGVEIRVGDRLYDTDTGCGRTVRAVNDNGTVEFDGHENRGWFGRFLTHRAPVLAADGEPLEVGQTVWHVGNGVEFTVIGLPNPGEYQAVKLRLDDGAFTGFDPDQLTHQRPVLDADGVPIDEGDTVWNATTSAGPFTVREIERSDDPDEPEDIVWCGEHAANGFKVWRIADQLTNTKPEPDSWSSVWADVSNGNETPEGMMRRCRALAKRGA